MRTLKKEWPGAQPRPSKNLISEPMRIYEESLVDTITPTGIGEEISNLKVSLEHQPVNGNTQPTSNLTDLLHAAKIHLDDEVERDVPCLQIIQNNQAFTFGTLGNFMAIIGKAKSRKSFLVAIMVAVAIVKSLYGLMKSSLPADKNKVLYFDTEQSKYHVHKALQRICTLSEINQHELLEIYSLRKHSPAERLELIEHAIYNTENVGLVVIDGIRDLITSVNDEEQATMITSKLLKWTEERNIHIIIVLHQNKGDQNARGHVGSEIVNKAETVLSVTKDSDNKNISVVQPEQCRDKEFELFAFQIDQYGIPFIDEDFISKRGERKKAFTESDIPKETHQKIINEVFAFNPAPKYAELVLQLQVYFNKHGISLGENKIKAFITFYLNEKFIVKEGKPRQSVYKLFSGLS